ncbi:MAG: pyrroline-5-carboxylate reductase [Blautia sp.]|nr:pyrroline-5-carboxylate reductase [Blautia sp.]
MEKIAFIGMGNMAQALAAGFISSGKIKGEDITAFAPNQEKLHRNAEKIGFIPASDSRSAVKDAGIVIMACKPYQIIQVLEGLGDALNGKALISVAAGWDYKRYSEVLDPSVRFQFVMPNTPAMVGEGVLLFEETNSLEQEERREIMELFGTVGDVHILPSRLMGIGGAVSGCSPAFIDMLLEAFADAGVKYGLPRETAYRLIAKTALGSAALQMATGEHPGALKDKVCSPGGTTIAGVAALEEAGFRNACIKAIDAVMQRG